MYEIITCCLVAAADSPFIGAEGFGVPPACVAECEKTLWETLGVFAKPHVVLRLRSLAEARRWLNRLARGGAVGRLRVLSRSAAYRQWSASVLSLGGLADDRDCVFVRDDCDKRLLWFFGIRKTDG